jgi:hypothetical protein
MSRKRAKGTKVRVLARRIRRDLRKPLQQAATKQTRRRNP